MTPDLQTLTRLINNEVLIALGIRPESRFGEWLQPLLAPRTVGFCRFMAEADARVRDYGLVSAGDLVIQRFTEGAEYQGQELVPTSGPLVILSNHPGTLDSAAVVAGARRDDTRVIASGVPFLRNLTNLGKQLVYLPKTDMHLRMLAVREALRHLRAGGTLLIFARGKVDPDPRFMPDADAELGLWSHSAEVFLKGVPGLRVVTSIVSGALHAPYMQHPLTRVRRGRRERQSLAEMLQFIDQVRGRHVPLRPRVSFGMAGNASELRTDGGPMSRVIEVARDLLRAHMKWESDSPVGSG